jgi:hypothetical protein
MRHDAGNSFSKSFVISSTSGGSSNAAGHFDSTMKVFVEIQRQSLGDAFAGGEISLVAGVWPQTHSSL